MKLDVVSIRQRLSWMEQYIGELEKHQAATVDELRGDFTLRLAVERALQVGIECCTDIARDVVSVHHLGEPEENRDLFCLLGRAGFLDDEFAAGMAKLVDFRNWLVHNYWEVDPEQIREHLRADLSLLRRFRDLALQLVTAEESAA